LKERYILTKVVRTWRIDEKGDAVIATEKTFLFYAAPDPLDLSDTAFGSGQYELKTLGYISRDSEAVDYEKLEGSMHRIFWKPKSGEIRIGEPYVHHNEISFPCAERPVNEKSLTIAPPVSVMRFDLSVESKIPIQEVVAYKGSRFQSFKAAKKIVEKARRITRTKAPLHSQPDEYHVTWSLENLTSRDVYFLVLFFENGRAAAGGPGSD
jgi:hypothetical protein